ncbi:MAG TPA: hypothetical protein VHO03_13520 [Ignavibacteriales bacterium]|nr:hypothetical protein [Ignavibacteriales bacterium]
MLKFLLIIAALAVTSSQMFCQEEETPEKWKVTSVDTLSFRDYNFYKISLTEAKLTRYLVSKKENLAEADKTSYSKIKKGDFLDISIIPVEPAITMELTDARSPQSFKIKDHYITKNDTVQVQVYSSPEVIGQYCRKK